MPHLHAPNGPTRLVAFIPGVPDSQAHALDRRRRLHRQLQGFRSADRGATAIRPTSPLNEAAERVPA